MRPGEDTVLGSDGPLPPARWIEFAAGKEGSVRPAPEARCAEFTAGKEGRESESVKVGTEARADVDAGGFEGVLRIWGGGGGMVFLSSSAFGLGSGGGGIVLRSSCSFMTSPGSSSNVRGISSSSDGSPALRRVAGASSFVRRFCGDGRLSHARRAHEDGGCR
jgi:hypothetical protein